MGLTLFPPNSSRVTKVIYSLVAVFALGVILLLVSPVLPIGGPLGYWDARRDLARGEWKYRQPMFDRGWQHEWRTMLARDYGIQVVIPGPPSCVVVPLLVSYDQAYNQAQSAAIRQRFGWDVIQVTRQEYLRRRAQAD